MGRRRRKNGGGVILNSATRGGPFQAGSMASVVEGPGWLQRPPDRRSTLADHPQPVLVIRPAVQLSAMVLLEETGESLAER